MAKYHLQIITPGGKIFDGQVTIFNAPGEEGRFSVWAGHAPMISKIKKGTAKITQDDTEKFLSLEPGIVEVKGDHNVTVLSNAAQFIDAPEAKSGKPAH